MLSDTEIEDFEKTMKLPLVGVFCKDQLPVKKYIGDYYINLQDHDKGDGTHWTFFKIFENGDAIYFDPFGMYMPEQVRQFLLPFKPVAVNNREIQDYYSECCGHFCEACSYFMTFDFDKKKSVDSNFTDFLSMFSDNTKNNDRILKEYLTN